MEEIFIPASGMAGEDVLVTEWLKAPGDSVMAGEPVVVVETDKAVIELSGTGPGRLSRHLVSAGDRVPGGTTVAYLLAEGESEPGTDSLPGPEPGEPGPVGAPPKAEQAAYELLAAAKDERNPEGRHRLSPRRRGIVAAAPVHNGTVEAGEQERTPAGVATKSNREATAALVSESWHTVPHFSVARDVRADALLASVAVTRASGTAVTVTDFLALALARGLRVLGEPEDVGLAVATDWGVLIPALRSLSSLSLAEVASLREAAVNRARSRRLASSDAVPPFATLSNLGPSGVTWFTGVVPVGQVALLTVAEISPRPVVEGRDVVVAPTFTAVLTADHRRYDGADSAKLLGAFIDELSGLTPEEAK